MTLIARQKVPDILFEFDHMIVRFFYWKSSFMLSYHVNLKNLFMIDTIGVGQMIIRLQLHATRNVSNQMVN